MLTYTTDRARPGLVAF